MVWPFKFCWDFSYCFNRSILLPLNVYYFSDGACFDSDRELGFYSGLLKLQFIVGSHVFRIQVRIYFLF